MSSFFEIVEARAQKSLLCVGLDPRSKNAADAKHECFDLIDQTAEFAACFKPNAAFFEAFGIEGWKALADVVAKINAAGVPCILDAKRGDIGATSEAYAKAAFTALGAGAITASPYMGFDSLAPFMSNPRNGVFVLCKTSNKGSNEFQTLSIAGTSNKQLFEVVAQTAEEKWNKKNGNVGLVVGATDPSAIARVRAAAPTLWFLVPGVGAQGGDMEQSIAAGLRARDGSGLLINVSRGISGAANPRLAAKKLSEEINAVRAKILATAFYSVPTNLADALLYSKCVRLGSFKLKSGLISPIYLDLRRLVTHPAVMKLVAKEYAALLASMNIKYDRLCGLPYAALPIATAVSLETGKPLIYPRREAKEYGTKATIEGDFNKGDRVVIIDDLVTTGETKIEAIEKLQSAGLQVVSIVVLIDREQGATKFLGDRGYDFRAVTNLTKLLASWSKTKSITQEQHDKVVDFMKNGNQQQNLKTSKL